MTDEQLIIEWNRLKNKTFKPGGVTTEDINRFSEAVTISYKSGDISKEQTLKYAEIIKYLKDADIEEQIKGKS